MKRPLIPTMVIMVCSAIPQLETAAQISITVVNTPVTQNFNTLPASGSNLSAMGGIFTEGWSFLENGTAKNTFFETGTGSSNTGDTYSLGNGTERAFGMLQSGSLTTILGFTFINNTGQWISSLTIGFTVEVWRLSALPDALTIAYQLGDHPLDAPSGWLSIPSLQFSTPAIGSGPVDGNTGPYRTVISPVTITGLDIPPGEILTLRWTDATATSSAAMALDDFTLILHPAFTGYFRSRNSGNWQETTAWEMSSNGNTWSPATTVVPSGHAAGTTIMSNHTISVTNNLTTGRINVQPAGKLLWSAGSFSLADALGDDLVLQGAGSEWEVTTNATPMLMGAASVRVGPGAILKLSGTNQLLAYHSNAYTYGNEATCEYSYSAAPAITGILFRAQDAGAIPVFRYNSPVTTSLGGSGATDINGRVEVTGGRTLNLNGVSGSLVIRNGITGEGNISSSTNIQLTGTLALLGGDGTISSNLVIQPGCTTTVLTDKTFSSGRTINVNGSLDFGNQQFRTASGAASLMNSATGTLITTNPDGLLSGNGSLKSGAFSVSFAPGSTVVYAAGGNQQLSIVNVPAYQNLSISGSGIKTVQSGGNIVVQGSCKIETGATLALTGNASENLYLNNNAVLQVSAGATFDNGGESSITASGGSPSVQISGTFRTKDAQGFAGPGAAIPSIVPVLSSGSTIEYGRLGDQAIQATLPYHHLACSGAGTKTPSNALSLAGTVTIKDEAILNGSSHTIGGLANNLVMTGSSRLVVGVTGTQPALGGTYSLAPGTTIEFANNNNTTTFIRQGSSPVTQFANIDITGSNITAPHSGITLQAGAVFRVKAGGVLKLSSVNGLHATSSAAVLTTNASAIILEPGSTIEYNGAAQAITTGLPYSHLVITGTGDKTAASAFPIAQTFTRSGDASLKGNSPVFSSGATLVYKDVTPGRVYTPGLEWPLASGPGNITVDLSGTGLPSVRLAGDGTIPGDLSLVAGGLDLNSRHLHVGGNITGMGTLKGSPTSVIALQGGTSTLRFSQTTDGATNALASLVVKSGTVSLGNCLQLYDVLDLQGGSLDLGHQSLVLKSGPTQTARVAERKGSLLNATQVTVERLVKPSLMRRWRLLTAPVNGSSINAAWQEGRTWVGGTPDYLSPGFGTLITGQQQGSATTANAAGFDFWPAIANSQASIRRYQGGTSSSATWQPVSSTLTPNFNNSEAYLLFIRGDRSVVGTGNGTVLRATGELREPLQFSVPVNTAQSHTLIGNPYASPIHFKKLYDENNSVIKPYFWIWQASLSTTGGYALVKPETEGSNLYEIVPYGGPATSNMTPVISSGEGFFVVPSGTSSAGNLVIKQSHKTAESSAISVLRQAGDNPPKLYVNLLAMETDQATLQDGVLLQFSRIISSTVQVGIGKTVNNAGNISVYQAQRDWQVAELPLPANDTVTQLRLWGLENRTYQLQVRSRDFNVPGLGVWIRDHYLAKEIPVILGNELMAYEFSTNSEAASRDPLRFNIIYRVSASLPLTVQLTNLKVMEQQNGVQVSWEGRGEEQIRSYTIERSPEGQHFLPLGNLVAKGGAGPNAYAFPDLQPLPQNFYRLKCEGIDGSYQYSSVVKWENGVNKEGIQVMPNPVTGGRMQVQLLAKPKGRYRLRVYSLEGKAVWQHQFDHAGGTATLVLDAGKNWPAGIYTIESSCVGAKPEHLTIFYMP